MKIEENLNTTLKKIVFWGVVFIVTAGISWGLLRDSPELFFFIVSIILSGTAVRFFFKDVEIRNKKDNFLNSRISGWLLWGIIVNSVTMWVITKKPYYDISIYTNFWTLITVIVITCIFSFLGIRYKEYGNKIVKYWISNITIIGIAILFFVIGVDYISKLPVLINAIKVCNDYICIVKNILFFVFGVLIIIYLLYIAYLCIGSLKGHPKK